MSILFVILDKLYSLRTMVHITGINLRYQKIMVVPLHWRRSRIFIFPTPIIFHKFIAGSKSDKSHPPSFTRLDGPVFCLITIGDTGFQELQCWERVVVVGLRPSFAILLVCRYCNLTLCIFNKMYY